MRSKVALVAIAAALLLVPLVRAAAAPPPAARAPCTAGLKRILLIRRKPGMTAAAFRDYYEQHHAPMAIALLGHYLADYRRNFVLPDTGNAYSREPPGYDVVTELWFRDRATLDAFTAFTRRPEVVAQIVADEERFMDRPATRQFAVDECRSAMP